MGNNGLVVVLSGLEGQHSVHARAHGLALAVLVLKGLDLALLGGHRFMLSETGSRIHGRYTGGLLEGLSVGVFVNVQKGGSGTLAALGLSSLLFPCFFTGCPRRSVCIF
jgi:hypothetical protein